MPKPLFAIISCHKFGARRNSQRKTWILRILGGADYKYFLGKAPVGTKATPEADEIWLDVEDDYNSLPSKVKAVMEWAIDNGYGHVMKIDDDVYIYPERVLEGYKEHTYIGHPNGWVAPAHPKGYMSGFAYWLCPEAVKAVSEGQLDHKIPHEDRWVGGVLYKAGLNKDGGYYDKRYIVVCTHQKAFWKNLIHGAAFAQFEPGDMEYFHLLCMGQGPKQETAMTPRLDRPSAIPSPIPVTANGENIDPRDLSSRKPGNRIFRLGRLSKF